jgi:hypothetical protein
MRKMAYMILGMATIVGMIFMPGGVNQAAARMGISINIGLPALIFSAPPPVVVVPGTYVYAVPDIDATLLFYDGYWYWPNEGRWYISASYEGPWSFIEWSRVPRVLADHPTSDWRVPPGYHHIPYADFHENWRRWTRERHWDRDRNWRAGWNARPEEEGHEWGRGHEERGRGPEGHGRYGG